MKRCPTCHSIYTDDSLTYCLQDGSKLAVASNPNASADATWQLRGEGSTEPPPTEILRPEDMPTVRIQPTAPTKEQQRARPTALDVAEQQNATIPASRPRSNASVIALSAIVALLLIIFGGLITWLVMRDKGSSESRITTSNSNTTPQPSPGDAASVQREVQDVLNAWADSIRQRNIDEHMKFYVDKLDVFYNSENVGADAVRSIRLDAFSRYSTMDVKLSKTKIEITEPGTRATATFDKTFDFKGSKNFSGKVQSILYLAKTGGRWRITGEKDLQVYYVNK